MLHRLLDWLDTWLHRHDLRASLICLALDIQYGYGPDCIGWRDVWYARAMRRVLWRRDNSNG
jgi:hypothetical protein